MSENTSNSRKDKSLKYSLFLVSIISILLSIALVYYFQKYYKTNEELQIIKTGYEFKSWPMREIIETTDFDIKINSVQKDTVGIPKYLPVPEGFMFVTVDLDVSNNTSEDKLFLPVNNTYIRDQQGNRYNITATPQVEYSIAGSIAPGDTAHGQIGYLVPTGVEHLIFYFEPYGENGGNTIAIDLDIDI